MRKHGQTLGSHPGLGLGWAGLGWAGLGLVGINRGLAIGPRNIFP
jgi:hypothetical protein